MRILCINPLTKPDQVTCAIGISLIFALAGDLTLYAVLPAFGLSTGIYLVNIGVLLSANRFVRFISNPLVGLLLNTRRRKKFLVSGLLIGALTTLLYQFHNQFWIFLMGRILWGIAFSITFITAYSMVMDITERGKRGRGSGLLQTYYLIGFAITPLLGAMLYTRFDYAATMIICSLLGFMGAAIAFLFVPETLHLSDKEDIGADEGIDQTEQSIPWYKQIVQEFRRLETVISNLIFGLTFFVGEGILMSTITYFYVNVFGENLTLGGFVISAVTGGGLFLCIRAFASALAAPYAGKASDASRNKWSVIAIGAGAGILGLLIIINVSEPLLLLIGIALFAINSAAVQAVIPAILMDTKGSGKISLRLGMMATSADIGLALAPLISYSILLKFSIITLYNFGVLILAVSFFLAVYAALRNRSRKFIL